MFEAGASRHLNAVAVVPVMKPIFRLNRKEKSTVDCDYLTRPGNDLKSAQIYIVAAFTTVDGKTEVYTPVAFSGRRDASGSFKWTHGSSYISPLDQQPNKLTKPLLLLIPFGGGNRKLSSPPTAEVLFDLIKSWSEEFRDAGFTVFVSTMIDGKYD